MLNIKLFNSMFTFDEEENNYLECYRLLENFFYDKYHFHKENLSSKKPLDFPTFITDLENELGKDDYNKFMKDVDEDMFLKLADAWNEFIENNELDNLEHTVGSDEFYSSPFSM